MIQFILGYVSEGLNELAILTRSLQAERGQSALMLGAGSNTPQLELVAARKETDHEVKQIHVVNEHIHDTGDVELIKGNGLTN